jgi:hypothetical protein
MIGWGTQLLDVIASREGGMIYTAKSFLRAYPFFSTPLSPRSHAYLLNLLITPENMHLLRRASFKARFEDLAQVLSEEFSQDLDHQTDEAPRSELRGILSGIPPKPCPPSLLRATAGRLAIPLRSKLGSTLAKANGPYVHQLPLERDFLDYLRLALGVRRMYEEHALAVKGKILERIEEFRRSLHCR